MMDGPELVDGTARFRTDVHLRPKYLGIINLCAQSFSILIVIAAVFIRSTIPLTTTCIALGLGLMVVGYHNVRRTLLNTPMPSRLRQGDPRVRLLWTLRVLLILATLALCVGAFCVLLSDIGFASSSSHLRRIPWILLYPLVVLFGGCSDYIADRLPLPARRMKDGNRKIWDSIQPIQSEHWGERGAS